MDVLNTKPDEIKEISYKTKQVETSITILESPENDVVIESLLFLSKYADLNVINLNYLQICGLLPKLLNLLFNRNICILRLTLRLIDILLTLETAISELDQEIYDEHISQIADTFIQHPDNYMEEYSLSILTKIATSTRISQQVIFNVALLQRIFQTIESNTDNTNFLANTLLLLYMLLDAPGAITQLPDIDNFSVLILMNHLYHEEKNIIATVLEILRKLTHFSVEAIQKLFREQRLVELMLRLLMDPNWEENHRKITSILSNCLNSDETGVYFIESIEFLDFCQWMKTCQDNYLLISAHILEKLSKIPSLRQTLFDLSVEDSILFLLRTNNKEVLKGACEAIINMTSHKYCCERMLTPIVIKKLMDLLNDAEMFEVSLKTIFHFTRRHYRTMDMLFAYNGERILMEHLNTNLSSGIVNDDSLLCILEILNRFVLHEQCQERISSEKFFQFVCQQFQHKSIQIAKLALEIMTNCVTIKMFKRIFAQTDGPRRIINKLIQTKDQQLFKNILIFIYSIMCYDEFMTAFLHCDILMNFRKLPEEILARTPLIERIKHLIYSKCLPIKLFYTGKLEMTDKLKERFYLINGRWQRTFPCLEVLECLPASTIQTIYVVQYETMGRQPSEVDQLHCDLDGRSESLSNTADTDILQCHIHHGYLSPDPYLPRFINHIKSQLPPNVCLCHRVKLLAEYVDSLLCGQKHYTKIEEKIRTFKYHIQTLKFKLGTSMIPIGYLRMGFHCERALMFKAIADKIGIPTSLIKGKSKLYWNEVALIECCEENCDGKVERFVVDLMFDIGKLMAVGSREAQNYCTP